MSNPWKPLRRALLAIAVLGLAACEAGDIPIQPDDAAPSLKTVNGVTFVPLKSGRTLSGAAVQRVQGKSGTTITLDDATLNVLPGSTSDPNVTITMEAVNDGYVTFKFGPNGLGFSPPAKLTISASKADLTGISTTDLAIAGASDGSDDWQVIGGTYDPVTNTVTVEIHHFSRYALCID